MSFYLLCRGKGGMEMWMEQCWRDVLKILFEMEDKLEEFNTKYPVDRPLHVTFVAAQQFILSRTQMRRRPLSVYKKLLHIINEQTVCHEGEPDYKNLFATNRLGVKVGPEPSRFAEDSPGVVPYGKHIQGGTMEHLAHVIFGHHELNLVYPKREVLCQNFVLNCRATPCYAQVITADGGKVFWLVENGHRRGEQITLKQ